MSRLRWNRTALAQVAQTVMLRRQLVDTQTRRARSLSAEGDVTRVS